MVIWDYILAINLPKHLQIIILLMCFAFVFLIVHFVKIKKENRKIKGKNK